MSKLNVPPTKSSLLALKKQLAFAEEGYDLLEQKRQILICELMNRLDRASQVEGRLRQALAHAYAAVGEALLDAGRENLDRAALAVKRDHAVNLTHQRLMGLRIPRLQAQLEPPGPSFGPGGTSASTGTAALRFGELLPVLVELAELQNALLRLARELRKTQRRCNALSKIFIPAYRETITYIATTLEERERETFVIHKIVRNRLRN